MKICTIGNGLIVPWFLDAVKKVDGVEVIAACGRARSEDKLRAMAAKYEIPLVYLDMETMLKNPEIDTVYVGISNHVHYACARQALLAGRNVIVEKPFTASLPQAEALADLAREKGLFLFEAAPNRYFPTTLKMKELLPRIGTPRLAVLNYSQYSSRYDRFKKGDIAPVFNPEMAGGSLVDLGIYNIYLLLALFGEPDRVFYHANIVRGIDTSGVLVLEYPQMRCMCAAAKDCGAPTTISIQGDEGYMFSPCAANTIESFDLVLNSGEKESYTLNSWDMRMVHQIAAFRDMVEAGDHALCEERLKVSLAAMKILDEARTQAGLFMDFQA